MNDSNFQEDEILLHLSHRPRYFIDGLISVDELTEFTFAALRPECPSALGRLDNLPLEVLHECLKYLDLRSLRYLACVSRRSKAVVDSLPIYKFVVETAGHTFQVLNQARVLDRHSITTLYVALRSEECFSCGLFGAFLLLLSAERCCLLCLMINQSHWMISLPLAKECFGFTKQQLNQLPVMWSIPRKYGIMRSISRQKPMRLTTVAAAKELALEVHGLIEAIATKFPLDRVPTSQKVDMLNWLRQAPLPPMSQDPLTINEPEERILDDFCGMGAIPFPSSRLNQEVEWGHWCRGCEFTYEDYELEGMDSATLARLVPEGRVLGRMQNRGWSRADFLNHAKFCHSATTVISQKWIGSS